MAGFIVGVLVGLTSVGSGSVIMALLVLSVPISTHRLIGTNVAHASLLVGVAALAHFFLGDVDLECNNEMRKLLPFAQYVQLALSHALYSQNEDGSWTVEVPVLPGCITWAPTRDKAVEMAKDAIEGWVLTALRFGDEVPEIDGCSLQYAVDELLQAA